MIEIGFDILNMPYFNVNSKFDSRILQFRGLMIEKNTLERQLTQ